MKKNKTEQLQKDLFEREEKIINLQEQIRILQNKILAHQTTNKVIATIIKIIEP